MAYTLLQIVNKALRRLSMVQGDSGELTALTSTAFQTDVDVLIQAINETVDDLYGARGRPQSVATSTITLVTNTREYALASDVETIIGSPPQLLNETDGYRITEYPGGYEQMVSDQLQPANWTGRAGFFAISPVNGQIRLDRIPTSAENGEVYTYRYYKAISITTASQTFPFSDRVADNLVPAFAERYKQARKMETYDATVYGVSMAAAARLLNKVAGSTGYGTRRYG